MNNTRKIAQLKKAGWCIVPGAYVHTNDDVLGRWYIYRRGCGMAKKGKGYRSIHEAWVTLIRWIDSQGV